jgi:hypothetical protein
MPIVDTCPPTTLEELRANPLTSIPACHQIWTKPLSDGGVAVNIVNFDSNPVTVTCDSTCMAKIGFSSVSAVPTLAAVSESLQQRHAPRL